MRLARRIRRADPLHQQLPPRVAPPRLPHPAPVEIHHTPRSLRVVPGRWLATAAAALAAAALAVATITVLDGGGPGRDDARPVGPSTSQTTTEETPVPTVPDDPEGARELPEEQRADFDAQHADGTYEGIRPAGPYEQGIVRTLPERIQGADGQRVEGTVEWTFPASWELAGRSRGIAVTYRIELGDTCEALLTVDGQVRATSATPIDQVTRAIGSLGGLEVRSSFSGPRMAWSIAYGSAVPGEGAAGEPALPPAAHGRAVIAVGEDRWLYLRQHVDAKRCTEDQIQSEDFIADLAGLFDYARIELLVRRG